MLGQTSLRQPTLTGSGRGTKKGFGARVEANLHTGEVIGNPPEGHDLAILRHAAEGEAVDCRWTFPGENGLRWRNAIRFGALSDRCAVEHRVELESSDYLLAPARFSVGAPGVIRDICERYEVFVGSMRIRAVVYPLTAGSADEFVTLLEDATNAFYSLSELVYESSMPFSFDAIRVGKKAAAFNNSLYPRYAGLNKFELPFATALDDVGLPWHRNPSSGGFFIPLLSEGDTSNFYPDFIVWKKGMVYCLDTKGSHLLSDAVARKLFDIQEDHKTKLLTRFITEGKQSVLRGKSLPGGYTVWKMKSGSPTPVHVDSLDAAVKESLK